MFHSLLQTHPKLFDDDANGPGLGTILIKGADCDIVALVVPTKSRVELVDFSHPPLFAPTSFLIAKPAPSFDLLAVVEPFQLWVWIAMGIAFLAVVLSWHIILKLKNPASSSESYGLSCERDKSMTILYTLRTLLKEPGETFQIKRASILLVVGSWSLAALILTNYYNTLLISYVSAPNPKPLIKSFQDLHDPPDLFIVTDEVGNTNALLSAADSGFFQEIRDKLNSYPKSRCTTIRQCVELVKSGSHVYISGRDAYLYGAMKDDFAQTGKCNLELGPECFILPTAITTRKNSPYMNPINYGLMKMREAGLVDHWIKEFRADAHQCVQKRKTSEIQPDDMSPLTLFAFTGAFATLLMGVLLSLIVFSTEMFLKAVWYNTFYPVSMKS